MVDKSYMLAHPPAPSALKVRFDQQVVPALIDAAGTMEAGLERVAGAVRRSPRASLAIAAGVAFLLAQAARLRRT